MLEILSVIAPLFIIIFVTAFFERITHMGSGWGKTLNAYALKVGLPVLIFSALARTSFSFGSELTVLLLNSIFLIGSFALVLFIGFLLRLSKQMRSTLFISFAFGNIAYLGIPVLSQVEGAELLPRVSLIIAVHLFWLFTIGIGYLEYMRQRSKKHIFANVVNRFVTNPLLLAVVFGLLFGGFGIKIPAMIMTSFDMISASVTPVVLVVIGLFIGNSRMGNIYEWAPVLVFSVVSLFVLPALLYGIILLFGLSPALFSSSIIEAAMPVAITPFALADEYRLNKTFISRSIVLSTVLAAVSLPWWFLVL